MGKEKIIQINRKGSRYDIILWGNGKVINYKNISSRKETGLPISFSDVISAIATFYPEYHCIQLSDEVRGYSNIGEVKALEGLVRLLDKLKEAKTIC